MTDLSPAARAIANAIEPLDWESGHCTYEDIRFISRQVAAAALRAAADQVVPEGYRDAYDCCLTIMQEIRDDLLAIAAEIDPHQLGPDPHQFGPDPHQLSPDPHQLPAELEGAQ